MKNHSFSLSSLKIHRSIDFFVERIEKSNRNNNRLGLSINSNLNNIIEDEDFFRLKSKLSYFEDDE